MPINRAVDKEDVVHIYNGILLSHKKEWNLAISDNMGGPPVLLPGKSHGLRSLVGCSPWGR